uniref:Uncharacterized protein n=1 Tax=Zooxanthella nutricula TaxID=1333877 RepID=A0A7S2JWN2_9DINO|mmetsp:Transcript_36970/g.111732  ORF Transcript_36970/g.111732 Transcript_36970/m.111732 type:complete len:180 (+) Transcript_36970:169-708(+)
MKLVAYIDQANVEDVRARDQAMPERQSEKPPLIFEDASALKESEIQTEKNTPTNEDVGGFFGKLSVTSTKQEMEVTHSATWEETVAELLAKNALLEAKHAHLQAKNAQLEEQLTELAEAKAQLQTRVGELETGLTQAEGVNENNHQVTQQAAHTVISEDANGLEVAHTHAQSTRTGLTP